jgi:hypothetical protein
MVFRASRLQRDGYLLRRAKVDVARLKPEQIKHGAGLLRRITLAMDDGDEHDQAIVDWQAFRECHRLNR